MSFIDRLKHGWNAFRSRDNPYSYNELGNSYSYRPDKTFLSFGNERSIIASIYVRIMIDVGAMAIKHVRVDQNGKYVETINSSLNDVLTVSANLDQTARAFLQDAVMSLIDEGYIAIVPVETNMNPLISGSYDIQNLRVGQIIQWYPTYVKVRVYNEQSGKKEDIELPKKMVAIIENPLYAVMNETNSTLKRLISKLNLLDVVDSQSGSGKLDLIFQLPFAVKSKTQQERADSRKAEIERQLFESKYGIAYVDATEKITQLNRPAENNLMGQIEYLTSMLYSQLGLTKEVMDGTANEQTMLNYYNRTIEPILSAIVDEMKRKFLTKTARTQNQSIMFFRDAFKLVPVSSLAEIADKFTRNAILSANEVRAIVGYRPSDDPKADELSNKNMPQEAMPTEEEPYQENIPDNVTALEDYAQQYM